MATLSFYGAAGTVTGSCSMLSTGDATALIDCGLFQGNATVRALNEQPFPFEAASVDFLLLTHAHTDHSGLLPKLVKAGFNGPIYATEPSVDLLQFMLLDSARIQESDAKRSNRWRERRNKPLVEPLYGVKDAKATLKLLTPVSYEEWFEPKPGFHARYWNAGHILGSASVETRTQDEATGNPMRCLFSGDLGPDEKVFHLAPDAEQGFDYVVCESTYGDRERSDYTLDARRKALGDALREGLERGGNVVIPSFAVERSQELLHDIGALLAKGELPKATVFLDSPLAGKVTEVFTHHAEALDDVELPAKELFRDPSFRITQSVDDSKAINKLRSGAIIISASGMADAGRILHHLKNNIWRSECTVLFVGYQSPGTTGHIIQSGKKDVRIHGKEFRVNAAIRTIGNYSAHADQSELIDWIMERGPVVGGLFLNHGDDDARAELRDLLGKKGMDTDTILMPTFDESYDLTAGTPEAKGRATSKGAPKPRIDTADLQHDWYNDYAAFTIALANRMEDETSAAKRRELLAALEATLHKS